MCLVREITNFSTQTRITPMQMQVEIICKHSKEPFSPCSKPRKHQPIHNLHFSSHKEQLLLLNSNRISFLGSKAIRQLLLHPCFRINSSRKERPVATTCFSLQLRVEEMFHETFLVNLKIVRSCRSFNHKLNKMECKTNLLSMREIIWHRGEPPCSKMPSHTKTFLTSLQAVKCFLHHLPRLYFRTKDIRSSKLRQTFSTRASRATKNFNFRSIRTQIKPNKCSHFSNR